MSTFNYSTNGRVNYKEVVNPTFYDAQDSLVQLANSGDANAQKYLSILNFAEPQLVENTDSENSEDEILFTLKEIELIKIGSTIGVEARYRMINHLISSSGYKNIFDIACGYMPRAIATIKAGYDYVGLDIPAVIEKIKPATDSLFKDCKHSVYKAGDITNAPSVIAAANLLKGHLFITSESLLQFLNKSELVETLKNIRQTLITHGGAWYSTDMEVDYDRILDVVVNSPNFLERWKKQTKLSDEEAEIYKTSFYSLDDKIKFFEENGLKVERIPFYYDKIQLRTFARLSPETKEKLIELMKFFCIWKVTAIWKATETRREKESELSGTKVAEDLTIIYSISKYVIHCTLIGRFDTLSAPKFLELFDKISSEHAVNGIRIDMKKLSYMSSTGLRVILKMAKQLGKENVLILFANDNIKETFEMTGFTDLITLK